MSCARGPGFVRTCDTRARTRISLSVGVGGGFPGRRRDRPSADPFSTIVEESTGDTLATAAARSCRPIRQWWRVCVADDGCCSFTNSSRGQLIAYPPAPERTGGRDGIESHRRDRPRPQCRGRCPRRWNGQVTEGDDRRSRVGFPRLGNPKLSIQAEGSIAGTSLRGGNSLGCGWEADTCHEQ